MKKLLILVLILIISSGLYVYSKNSSQQPTTNDDQSQKDEQSAGKFYKTKYSIEDPSSIWVIVNKKRHVSLDYQPNDLVKPNVARDPKDSAGEQQIRSEVAAQVELLFADAKKAEHNLLFASGYRSSKLQATYYNGYVARSGQEAADKYSARPGTSEHQTGLAFDAARPDRKCYLEACFAETAEGKWLAENAHRYGFILRYKQDKQEITGYQYEPWHFRYVGVELANELYKSNQTMEEFFGL
jgi:D-alanyl-D-alanine carboxypeptidase